MGCGIRCPLAIPEFSKMDALLKHLFDTRRAFEETLAGLLREYQQNPRPGLARTIELFRTEIEVLDGVQNIMAPRTAGQSSAAIL